MKQIDVVRSVLAANEATAEDNRRRLDAAGVLAVNITSAAGSGKTSLLEQTVPALAPLRSAVIVGDLQTTRDAERLADMAVDIVQVNTEGGCHLTASMVAEALDRFPLDDLGFLFIENIGNMVCPSGFDLGERVRVAMLSVPEGDDKVGKYTTLFQPADIVLLNKVDLTGVLEYDVDLVRSDLARLNTRAPLIEMSLRTGQGVEAWLAWLREQRG
jgi:hydrogenase nickel incorporation protein HypB